MTLNALAIGDSKLTLAPISENIGILLKTLPNNKYNGDPGGWGTPKILDDAIYSPQSQNEVVGAIVII
tara:strand:+ start:425 stop:628 length:204 start_codon:yes stop_codon:yes gene_type:complete